MGKEKATMMTPEEVVRACKRTLRDHYGPRFRGLVLYGSMARHDDDESSDIDLLVLLEEFFARNCAASPNRCIPSSSSRNA